MIKEITHPIRKTGIPGGVSKVKHYNNILEEAEQMSMMSIYKNTMRFRPNYVKNVLEELI